MGADDSSGKYVLLDELAEEFAARYRRGERPSLQEYVDRHPELADDIRQLFPAMAGLEQAKEEARPPTGAASAEPAPALRQVGDFRLIREVGRGGMGVVYEAEQVSLGRRVALKVLARQAGGPQARERFRREARSAARLHHTNIVPVFEVGQDGDVCFYAMQFILGQALDEVVEELRRLRNASDGRVPTAAEPGAASRRPALSEVAHSLLTGRFRAAEPAAEAAPVGVATEGYAAAPAPAAGGSTVRGGGSSSAVLPGSGQLSGTRTDRRPYYQSIARIGHQVAAALAYAHGRGVVHRDVKPSNLLLDAAGVVWVTDFGLAKTDDDALTDTGDVVGTLRYMAPERFRGECDARADVYGLGLTLYELLTLRPAFDSADRLRLIDQVKSHEPARPRALDPRVPRDLETVVLKAIDKDARGRYQTAEEMAEDLRRVVADEPIRARQPSQFERVRRWCRHNKMVAFLSVLLLASLVTIAAGEFVAAYHYRQLAAQEASARREAEEARAEAEESYRQARRAVDDNLTKVSESRLLRVPGMQPLRKELLGLALGYYQDFLARRGDDPALRNELADAYARAARITAEIGSRAEAVRLQEKGLELRRALHEGAPDDGALTLRLVDDELALSALRRQAGDAAAARRSYRDAYALLLKVSPQELKQTGRIDFTTGIIALDIKVHACDDPEVQRRFADVLQEASSVEAAAGERVRAITKQLESLYAQRLLVDGRADHPGRLRFEQGLAGRWLRLGELEADAGLTEEALACHQQAKDLLAKLVRAHPSGDDAADFRHDLAAACGNIGAMHARTGRFREAIAAYEEALPVRRRLADENRAVTDFQADLTRTCLELGETRARAGDAPAALEILMEGLRRQQALAAGNAGDRAHARGLARYHLALARAYRHLGRPAEARDSFGAGCQTLEGLPPEGPEDWYLLAAGRAGGATVAAGSLPEQAAGAAAVGSWPFAAAAALACQAPDFDAAAAALRRAVDAGFSDLARLEADRDFAPLRGRADYRALAAEIARRRTNPLWADDFDAAKARAAREGKDLLLYFCGSDWDTNDKGFREKFLNGSANGALAAGWVAVEFDQPRHGPKPRGYGLSTSLARRWNVKNYPSIVVADAAGRPYAQVDSGVVANEDWTADTFLARLGDLRAARVRRDALLAKTAAGRGTERAAAIDRALGDLRPEFVAEYTEEIREIVDSAADDAAGLRTKYLYVAAEQLPPGAGSPADAAARERQARWNLLTPLPCGEVRRLQADTVRLEMAWAARIPVTFAVFDGVVELRELPGGLAGETRPRAALGAAAGAGATAARVRREPEVRRFVGHKGQVWGIGLSADGTRVLTDGADGTVRLWDRTTGKEVRRWQMPNGGWTFLAFAPGGRLAACGAADGVVRLFDLAAGGPPRSLTGHSGPVRAVAFSPDGRLVTGGDDGTVRVWEPDTGRELRRFESRPSYLLWLRVSPDGRRVLGGTPNHAAVAVWDYETGRLVQEVRVGDKPVNVVAGAFTPDGRHFLTGIGTELALWEADTVKQVLHFRVPAPVGSAAVAPDGRNAVASDNRAVFRVFRLTAEAARAAELMHTGPAGRAIEAWNKVVEREPDEPGCLVARARLYARNGRWDRAEADFAAAARLDPSDGDARAGLARCRALSGDWEGAARDFVAALNHRADPDGRRALAAELAEWQPAFAKALERYPLDPRLWQARGEFHLRRERWKEAAADLRQKVAVMPGVPFFYHQSVPLQIRAGDVTAYRLQRREMLSRFGATGDPVVAERVARDCTLLPVEPGEDLDRLMALTERMLAKPPPDKAEGRYCQLARGTAEYRKGDFAAAAVRLEDVARNGNENWWGLQSAALSVLAMARQRRGEPDKARATLAQEVEFWERDAPRSPVLAGDHGHDWLMCRILRREAEEVVLRGNVVASEVPGDWPPLPDDDAPSWAARGREHLRAGRPGPAAEAFARAVAREPDDRWLSYQAAALLAAADPAGYERHRREMLRRWGDAAGPQTAERVSKACLLRPAAGDELERAVRLAERAERSLEPYDPLGPYAELACALAEYRRGGYAAAERRLDRLLAQDKPQWNVTAPAWSVLALARHRLGHPRARAALDRAAALLKKKPEWITDPNSDGWHDRLIAEVLHREAEEAILGKATGKN